MLRVDLGRARLYNGTAKGVVSIDAREPVTTVGVNLGGDSFAILPLLGSIAGVDLLATFGETGSADRDSLARQAQVRVAADDSWSDIFSRILVEEVEPNLGNGRVTVLYEYPAVEAALARSCVEDPRVSERFELYACGVELANGFGELTDPREQRRRFEAEMAVKERLYGERYPIDEELLQALAMMPPAAGVALGLDRLIMLAAGAVAIEQVIWTPAP